MAEISINSKRILVYLYEEKNPVSRIFDAISVALGINESERASALDELLQNDLIDFQDKWLNLTAAGVEQATHIRQSLATNITIHGNVGSGSVVGSGTIRAGVIAGRDAVDNLAQGDSAALTQPVQDSSLEHHYSALFSIVEHEFVGRQAEIDMFNNVLSSAQKPVLFFHGIGGIGKSWLVSWLMSKCQERQRALVDFSETSHLDFLTVMTSIRNQIGSEDFSRFNEGLEEYKFIFQAQSVESFKLIRSLDQLVSQKHTNIEAKSADIVRYLSAPEAERMRMIQKARASLTNSFSVDFANLAESKKCVLFFDTIERVDTDTGKWLRDEFLPALISSRSKHLFVVLAGRKESVWAELGREWRYYIVEKELKNFNQSEVESYLYSRELLEGNARILRLIYELTKGHPLCVGLAADLFFEYKQSGDELDDAMLCFYKDNVGAEIISSFLTQRILDRLPPTLSQLIMFCSITHWFDAGLMRYLSIDPQLSMVESVRYLETIKGFSFVRPYFGCQRGYTFHEVVRSFLVLRWKRDDWETFRLLNKRALEYFQQELQYADPKTRNDLLIERVYHLLVVDEDAGMALFSKVFEEFDRLFKKDVCLRLVDVASEHEWDEEANKQWSQLARMLSEAQKQEGLR